MHIDMPLELTGTNHSTRCLVNTFDIHYSTNITHMVSILYRHVDPTFLYAYTKIQPTATSTSSVITTYVLETNVSTILGIYEKYLRSIYRNISEYMCHM